MKDSWAGRAIEFVWMKVVCLPLATGIESRILWRRVFALAIFCLWFFPVAFLMLPFLVVLLVCETFIMACDPANWD